MKRILAHGTFDIMHYGHINYLEKAKEYGDYLVVCITSDNLARENGKNPLFSEEIRMRMISSLKIVDEVILRDRNFSSQMIRDLDIDVFVTISHSFDYLNESCKVIHVARTEGISSSLIKQQLFKEEK